MLMILCQFTMKRCPDTFGDSKIRASIVRIARVNKTLKRPVNKLFTVEYTYHDTDQTNKARELKFRQETAVIGALKRKYEC